MIGYISVRKSTREFDGLLIAWAEEKYFEEWE